MQCPNCGLENPPSAMWCDCGYDFKNRAMRVPDKTTTVNQAQHHPKGQFGRIPVLRQMKQHASRLNDYFRAAAWTWLLKRDEAAHVAALWAAVTATGDQRASLAAYLRGLAADFLPTEVGSDEQGREALARMLQLAAEISAKKWSMWDGLRIRRALEKADREYYSAIRPLDPTVFFRRHPDLPEWLLPEG
ncbi:MAG: zinc ribbon domain-containing protein [Acidobacteria bacterium]|nr:zinc ribbon domain-containing protein [Acidobacteriota bacterium]